MGLAITAYKNLVLSECQDHEAHETGEIRNSLYLYKNHEVFKKQEANMQTECFYNYEDTARCLSLPYSSYSNFRDILAQISGYTPLTKDDFNEADSEHYRNWVLRNPYSASAEKLFKSGIKMPFIELIYFSDCEGFIGTDICKKLSRDFDEFDQEARAYSETHCDLMFYSNYEMFRDNIKYAIENGVLYFH